MSEQAPPPAAGSAAEDARPALTPQAVESLLSDFRAWLVQADVEGTAPGEDTGFDWQTLVRAFTALRHEVNLQTRATRAQMNQAAESLRRLDHVLDDRKPSAAV